MNDEPKWMETVELKDPMTKQRRSLSIVCLEAILLFGMIATLISVAPIPVERVKAEPAAWWDEDWSFRKSITFDHTKVAGDLVDFPVLVDVVDADLKSKAQSGGEDITFTDSLGNKLSHEIEDYDSGTGHLVAWVKVSTLSSTVDTTIYMYYGNPGILEPPYGYDVWDSNHVLVQHLEEPSGILYDSSLYANDGVVSGGVVQGATGLIDGADTFDGSTGYVTVPHSNVLTGYKTAFTVSLWIRFDTVSRRQVLLAKYDTLNDTRGWMVEYRSAEKAFAFFASKDGSTLSWWYTTFTPQRNTWYYLTIVWEAGVVPKFYINGQQSSTVNTGTVPQIFSNAGTPLHIGKCTYSTSYNFDGTLDEIRLSNVTRSHAWILTSYNNQRTPSTFYTLGTEEARFVSPISDEAPGNGAINTPVSLSQLAFTLTDPEGDLMDYFVSTSPNVGSGSGIDVGNGRYTVPISGLAPSTTYTWTVKVTDGTRWTNVTYTFTTEPPSPPLRLKWMVTDPNAHGYGGVLISDINQDGIEEVIRAGWDGNVDVIPDTRGYVTVYSGIDGSIIWTVEVVGVSTWAQPQMADLTRDGIPEIIVPIQYKRGIIALFANGTEYWRVEKLGGTSITASPVVLDIDGDGYPTIFAATEDIVPPLNGELVSISHDGRILQRTFSYRPCAGGLSIADTDGDGEFELYVTDRPGTWNPAGMGIHSYWAKNLTLRWMDNTILCSSHRPMIADVNKDGILDIIVGHQRGGLIVYNSIDGTPIRKSMLLYNQYDGNPVNRTGLFPIHYQPSVYDIDGDGNLEILVADGEHISYSTPDIVVWDLVTWQQDNYKRLNVGQCMLGPTVGEVTGDGLMDILAVSYTGLHIFNRTYDLVYEITGLDYRGNYAVVQDIDGDGLNEVVLATSKGTIYAFDTPASRQQPRPRTEVQFYSEYRLGAAEFVPYPGAKQEPVVSDPSPLDGQTGVPISLSSLSFTIADFQYDLMDYFVSTSPNVGSGSGIDVGNGRYTVPISGLAYSATYTWTVKVTDGTRWTNVTYTFTTEPPSTQEPIVSDPSPRDGETSVPVSLSTLSFTLTDIQNDLMSYSVVTSPNVGSGAGVNVGNGIYTVPVSGLAYSTTYTWKVNVTDGVHWTNVTYVFSTQQQAVQKAFLRVSCDNTTSWYFTGTASLDTQDFVEGTASIRVISGDASISYLKARYLPTSSYRDWTLVRNMSVWLKVSDRPIDVYLLAPDWNNRLYIRLTPTGNWTKFTWNISSMTPTGSPNLANVREIQFRQYCYIVGRWFKIDDILVFRQ